MKVKKLRCGGCGGEHAAVSVEVDDDYSNRDAFHAVILNCITCKSKTRLYMQAEIQTDNSVDSTGTFCVY